MSPNVRRSLGLVSADQMWDGRMNGAVAATVVLRNVRRDERWEVIREFCPACSNPARNKVRSGTSRLTVHARAKFSGWEGQNPPIAGQTFPGEASQPANLNSMVRVSFLASPTHSGRRRLQRKPRYQRGLTSPTTALNPSPVPARPTCWLVSVCPVLTHFQAKMLRRSVGVTAATTTEYSRESHSRMSNKLASAIVCIGIAVGSLGAPKTPKSTAPRTPMPCSAAPHSEPGTGSPDLPVDAVQPSQPSTNTLGVAIH